VAGWVSVEANEMLQLGEEVGVGDVKEVAGPVRLEPIALQNAMQRGLAGRHADPCRICQQTTCGPSQRPSSAVGQRLGLAVERHDAQLCFLRGEGGAPRSRTVVKVSCRVAASNPATHGLNRTLQSGRDGLGLNAGVGQRDHRISTRYVGQHRHRADPPYGSKTHVDVKNNYC